LLEEISYDGTLIWKLEHYRQKVSYTEGEPTGITGPTFYSHRYGYKMRCRVGSTSVIGWKARRRDGGIVKNQRAG